MRTYSITAFKNVYNKDEQIRLRYSWTNLCRFLGHDREPVEKMKGGLWSPATFSGARCDENVTSISCMVLDIDEGLTFSSAIANLFMSSTQSYLHSSISHSQDGVNKYRVILPLAEDAPVSEWSHYHSALGTWWINLCRKENSFDPKTKDPSRMYFVGYRTEDWREHHVKGKIIDWKGRAQDAKRAHIAEMRRRREEQEQRLREAKQKQERLGKVQSYSDKRRYMYTMLRNDPTAREQFARYLGATITGDGSSRRATRWSCPGCTKDDCTFFYIDPTRYPSAYCNHRNNCGWKEGVGYLAEINGYQL